MHAICEPPPQQEPAPSFDIQFNAIEDSLQSICIPFTHHSTNKVIYIFQYNQTKSLCSPLPRYAGGSGTVPQDQNYGLPFKCQLLKLSSLLSSLISGSFSISFFYFKYDFFMTFQYVLLDFILPVKTLITNITCINILTIQYLSLKQVLYAFNTFKRTVSFG